MSQQQREPSRGETVELEDKVAGLENFNKDKDKTRS